jgi:hypothetical protein
MPDFVFVHAYTRRDGTLVHAHWRHSPGRHGRRRGRDGGSDGRRRPRDEEGYRYLPHDDLYHPDSIDYWGDEPPFPGAARFTEEERRELQEELEERAKAAERRHQERHDELRAAEYEANRLPANSPKKAEATKRVEELRQEDNHLMEQQMQLNHEKGHIPKWKARGYV